MFLYSRLIIKPRSNVEKVLTNIEYLRCRVQKNLEMATMPQGLILHPLSKVSFTLGCRLDVFSNNSVGINDLFDLCRDTDELRIILLQSGLLGDRSGVCEICGKGNVNLTK